MLSPNRCLICYCKIEVISSSAEDRASPPTPPPLQTCHSHDDDYCADATDLQSEDKKGINVAECLSPLPENKVVSDLRAIFTLRELFQVPQEELAGYLSKLGSPGSWISLCSRCNKVVTNAQGIYQQILDATRILEGIKGDIRGMIKESLDSEPSPKDEEEIGVGGMLEVTVKTREFVRGCEYVQQAISDPFIAGDLKADEVLMLEELEGVSSSSGNDEDDDLMEIDVQLEEEHEKDAEQSIEPSSVLDSFSAEVDNLQSVYMTPPRSIQSPPKLSDCEGREDKTEEISSVEAEKEEENAVVENEKMEETVPTVSPSDSKQEPKSTNTIQLSFNIPKLPVIKKEQVPEKEKVETSWMVNVRPNIFAKESEGPGKPTTILKPLEAPVPIKAPGTDEIVIKSQIQIVDLEMEPVVQTLNDLKQTIKLEPLDNLEATVKPPEVLALNSVEVEIEQELLRNNAKPIKPAINPEAPPPENQKEVIKPQTHAPSKSKAIPAPSHPKASSTTPNISNVDDILGDLDPFVKELLSVPASKPPPKSKASMLIPTTSQLPSVKQPVQQNQNGQFHNNADAGHGHHGFDKKIRQENGTWRHHCQCGISYAYSSQLCRHITNMTKTTVVFPRNVHAQRDIPRKFQCFICKSASPSVLAIFSDINLLKAHLDQEHHTKIITPSATTAKPNEVGSGSISIQTIKNDGSFTDRVTEMEKQLSLVPIRKIRKRKSLLKLPPQPKTNVIIPTPPAAAPKSQQQPSSPQPSQPSKPKIIRSASPIIITTTALRSKPPSPVKRLVKPRWYVCRHCLSANPSQSKKFTCLAHLTNHVHSEHGGWLCPTPTCQKIFSTWMHLIAHRRKGCDKNVTISKSSVPQPQAQVQVLETSPITMPKLASRPKKTLEQYFEYSKVERKPITPRVLAAENDDDVICIDD